MKSLVSALLLAASLAAAPIPQIVRSANKCSLLVDGKPYIVLGAQVMNSSGWPPQFEKLLPGAEALHLNTIEVPLYWEDVEPQEGQFRFDTSMALSGWPASTTFIWSPSGSAPGRTARWITRPPG